MEDPHLKVAVEHHRLVSRAAIVEAKVALENAWRDLAIDFGAALAAAMDDFDREAERDREAEDGALSQHWYTLPAFAREHRRGRPRGHGPSAMSHAIYNAAILLAMVKSDYRQRTGRNVPSAEADAMLDKVVEIAEQTFFPKQLGRDRVDRDQVNALSKSGRIIATAKRLRGMKSNNQS